MQLIQNKWLAPLLAVFIVCAVSSARIYCYLDGALNAYAASFRVDTSDYYVYWTFHTRELQQMIDSLTARAAELNQREENLNKFQERLASEKKELDEIKLQLEHFRKSIGTVLVQARSDEMKNLKGLASTYASMSSEAVVGIFNQMDDNTVVKILSLMKSDTVGPIFEAMARLPNREEQMRTRITRLSEKMRLYKQAQSG